MGQRTINLRDHQRLGSACSSTQYGKGTLLRTKVKVLIASYMGR